MGNFALWSIVSQLGCARRRARKILPSGHRKATILEALQIAGELVAELAEQPPPEIIAQGGLHKFAVLAGATHSSSGTSPSSSEPPEHQAKNVELQEQPLKERGISAAGEHIAVQATAKYTPEAADTMECGISAAGEQIEEQAAAKYTSEAAHMPKKIQYHSGPKCEQSIDTAESGISAAGLSPSPMYSSTADCTAGRRQVHL